MYNNKEMSFIDHLEELRWNIIRSLVAVISMACVCFVFKDFIFDVIILGPSKLSFPTYKVLCNVAIYLNIGSKLCGEEFPFKIMVDTLGGEFYAHISTSVISGFIISFPYVLYELWKFISPGLHENERKKSKGFIFISSLLFFIGVLFGYYVVTPFSVNFLGNYSVSEQLVNMPTLSNYIGIIRSSSLVCGILFELPIIIYFLTKVGLVTPKTLIKYRKYSIIIVLILAAVITPPDVFSQMAVAIPVLILYQISIYISKFVIKKNK